MSTLPDVLKDIISDLEAKDNEVRRRAQARVAQEQAPTCFRAYLLEETAVMAAVETSSALACIEEDPEKDSLFTQSIVRRRQSARAEAIATAIEPSGTSGMTRARRFLQRLVDECNVDVNDAVLRNVCVEYHVTDSNHGAWSVLFDHPDFRVGVMLSDVAPVDASKRPRDRHYMNTIACASRLMLQNHLGPCATRDPHLLSHFATIMSHRERRDMWHAHFETLTIHRELLAIDVLCVIVIRALRATETQTTALWPSLVSVVFAYLLPAQSDVDTALGICHDGLDVDQIRSDQLDLARMLEMLDEPPVVFREPRRPAAAAAVTAVAPRRFSARLRARASAAAAAAAAPAAAPAPVLTGRKRKSGSATGRADATKLQRVA
jgi:hypothetical protein